MDKTNPESTSEKCNSVSLHSQNNSPKSPLWVSLEYFKQTAEIIRPKRVLLETMFGPIRRFSLHNCPSRACGSWNQIFRKPFPNMLPDILSQALY